MRGLLSPSSFVLVLFVRLVHGDGSMEDHSDGQQLLRRHMADYDVGDPEVAAADAMFAAPAPQAPPKASFVQLGPDGHVAKVQHFAATARRAARSEVAGLKRSIAAALNLPHPDGTAVEQPPSLLEVSTASLSNLAEAIQNASKDALADLQGTASTGDESTLSAGLIGQDADTDLAELSDMSASLQMPKDEKKDVDSMEAATKMTEDWGKDPSFPTLPPLKPLHSNSLDAVVDKLDPRNEDSDDDAGVSGDVLLKAQQGSVDAMNVLAEALKKRTGTPHWNDESDAERKRREKDEEATETLSKVINWDKSDGNWPPPPISPSESLGDSNGPLFAQTLPTENPDAALSESTQPTALSESSASSKQEDDLASLFSAADKGGLSDDPVSKQDLGSLLNDADKAAAEIDAVSKESHLQKV